MANPAIAAPPTWEHPGFDAEDSYYNPAESVINESSVGRLTRSWAVRLRTAEASCGGFSRPLVAGGRVVVTDKLGISAYATADGAPSWKFDWDWPDDNATPVLAVSGGLVIAANGDCNSQSDPDGQLTALDLTSGKVRWKLDLDTPVRSVVVDRGVVVTSGWSPSDEEVVAGYRASDGKALWSKPGWSSTGVSLNGVIVMRKTDGFGAADGGTSAIAVADGSLRWSRLENWAAEAAYDGLFYMTDPRGRLLAVDETDGAPLWSVPGRTSNLGASRPAAHLSADLGRAWIAVDGRRVYRALSRTVEALDVRDGRRVWSARLGREAGQPVRAGGLVYAGGVVLRAANGKTLGTAAYGSLIVSGGTVYGVRESELVAFSVRR